MVKTLLLFNVGEKVKGLCSFMVLCVCVFSRSIFSVIEFNLGDNSVTLACGSVSRNYFCLLAL